jgi:hypothetical protein
VVVEAGVAGGGGQRGRCYVARTVAAVVKARASWQGQAARAVVDSDMRRSVAALAGVDGARGRGKVSAR